MSRLITTGIFILCFLHVLSMDPMCTSIDEETVRTAIAAKNITLRQKACKGFEANIDDAVREKLCQAFRRVAIANKTANEINEAWQTKLKSTVESLHEHEEPIKALLRQVEDYVEASMVVFNFDARMGTPNEKKQLENLRKQCHATQTTLTKVFETKNKVVAEMPKTTLSANATEAFDQVWNQTSIEVVSHVNEEAKLAAKCLVKAIVMHCHAQLWVLKAFSKYTHASTNNHAPA